MGPNRRGPIDPVRFLVGQEDANEAISAESLVVIPDIEAEAFKVMLSFIYAEDLSELNGDNACLDFPINELSDVFLAYKQARLLNKKNFGRRCMDYIEQNVETLIKSESFLQIDQNLLYEICWHSVGPPGHFDRAKTGLNFTFETAQI
ncbi:hypothetical protein niasHT_032703 [Heterodera trifolii]|uniref:BTB domain-containing protein n=1 Tax=Heterodera trifolii TaxID=157864 RepID=A0ABD2IGR5_9BILA